MTTSWAGRPPTATSAVETAPFVVRTVRSAIRRRFRFVAGVQVMLALLVMALLLVLAHLADGALGALGLAPFLLILLSVGFQVGL